MNELERKLRQIENELNYLRNDSPLSSEEKEEKINNLNQEKNKIIDLINYFSDINVKINNLKSKGMLSKEEHQELNSLKENLNTRRKEFNKEYQGGYRDLISSFFGQIDKRIHNKIYKNNSLWRNKRKRVIDRYDNIGKYFFKNCLITSGIVLVPGLISLFVPAIAPYVIGAASLYFGQGVIKTIAAIYNKARYGGPRLMREYPIVNGYYANIENSWNKVLGNTLSMAEVRSIKKIAESSKVENLRTPTENDLKPKKDESDTLSLAASIINSVDINKITEHDINLIVDFVEKNNYFDKLNDDIKRKYLLIKSKLNKHDDENVLLNTINNKLESIDISSLSQEEKEKVIKLVNDNNLENKLSDKAHDIYLQLLSNNKKDTNEEKVNDFDKKVEYINDYKNNFKYNEFTIKDYEDMFKYISDNDLEKGLTDNNKKKYQQLKVIYKVIIDIRNFDLNNFDINSAKEIIKNVKDNKITKKLNRESYRKFQKIVSNINTLTGDKDNTNKKEDNNYKEKLIAFSNMLKMIDLSKLDLNELSSLIKYVEDNKLEKDLPDILDKLNKVYNVKIKNKPKMEDYGNKKIGISGNIKFIAEEFIKHPPKITKDMSSTEKNLVELARKIRNGNASSHDMDKYIMLIYELVDQKSFVEDYEDYLMDEYDKYQSDTAKYEGKKAK